MSKAVTNWEVTRRGLNFPDAYDMSMGCHHKKAATGACGGCYARLYQALVQIEDGAEPVTTIKAVRAAMRSEAKAKPKKRRTR